MNETDVFTTQRFSHRNGESDDPEVPGHYWVVFKFDGQRMTTVWEWGHPHASRWGLVEEVAGKPLEIHGPIEEPEWRKYE